MRLIIESKKNALDSFTVDLDTFMKIIFVMCYATKKSFKYLI